jgi:hypothetical protein
VKGDIRGEAKKKDFLEGMAPTDGRDPVWVGGVKRRAKSVFSIAGQINKR